VAEREGQEEVRRGGAKRVKMMIIGFVIIIIITTQAGIRCLTVCVEGVLSLRGHAAGEVHGGAVRLVGGVVVLARDQVIQRVEDLSTSPPRAG
jgi:hypothetical protein